MIKDIRYIIKRVIIGVLIVLVLSFIKTCEVKAESQVLSPSTLSLVKYYGNNYVIGSNRNCHNNVCWWNIDSSNANVTSVRWTASQTLTYSNVNLAVFNVGLYHTSLFADESLISDVSIGDYSCYYIKNENIYYNPDNNLFDEEFNGYGITALCPLGGTINYSNGSKTANITFNNSGTVFTKYSISNITFTKDDKLIQMLTYLGNINNAINTTNSNLDVVKQDLTYLLQAQNNTSYWAEVNSGKLESIKNLLTNQTTAIVSAQQQTTTAVEDNTQAVNDVNDTLNNSNVSINSLPSDNLNLGPISALVTLPITALNNIINAFSGTCTPFNIGSLLGTNLVFPCIDIESFIGSFLWNTIDIIVTGIYIFGIRKHFVDLFYKLVSLKDIGLKGGF